jgi:zinc transport system substrate-binding protein
MKVNYIALALFIILGTVLSGCGAKKENVNKETQNNSTASETLKIYTTIYPLEDFTKKIGGEHVEVVSVYPPGVDAHTFEPTAKTMVDIANSDAFIYSGAGVEGFVDAAIESLKKEQVKIVKGSENIDLLSLSEHAHESEDAHSDHEGEDGHEGEDSHEGEDAHSDHEGEDTQSEHNHGDLDPHIWLDPVLSIQLAENILHVLEELKPDAKEELEQNFEKLKHELEELDHQFKEVIEQSKHKEILVSHAAYGYWESRYGIEQISVTGLSPTNEPSQKDLQTIIETAKEHNIKYVIFEQNLSTKIADIVKNEIKAEALTLHNLEAITDEDIQNNEDYFSIMRRNLDTLEKALN